MGDNVGCVAGFCAGVTQLAECQLPKLNVAGSNPVARSSSILCNKISDPLAAWRSTGL